MPDTPQEQITPRQFARRMGQDPSAGNHLAKNSPHRLIWADNGTHVLWPASREHYLATTDNMANTLRHAQARAARKPATDAPPPPAPELDPATTDPGAGYQTARAVKEKYLALAAKRDYEVEIGKLLPKDAVAGELANAIVTLRSTLEHMPQVLGPVLAGISDEHACTAAIADHVEQALTECATAFARITAEPQT